MRGYWTLLLSFLHIFVLAQDIHFTQWMHAPHTYTPASIGDFDGKYRFHANYKRQWASVTVPFTTFAVAADSRQFTQYEKLGLGASVLYDVTGDSRFSTTVINAGGSWRVGLGDSIGYVQVAVQPSIVQKKIDMTNLNFDEQYNGFYFDSNAPVTENLARNSRWYFDMAIGAQLNYRVNSKMNLVSGVSVYNLLKPKQSFFDNSDIRLDRRFVLTSQLEIKHSKEIKIYPGIMWSNQGKFNAVNFGGLVDYDLTTLSGPKQSVFAGVYFRAVDSGDIMVGMNYDNWRGAVSYDINYSGLTPASNYKGGLELALIYIIPVPAKRPRYRVCPDYL